MNGSSNFRRSFSSFSKTLTRKKPKMVKAKRPFFARGAQGAMRTAGAQGDVKGVPARFR